ncbi:MAG: TlyA family RNA methyltransferase [Actinomycetia bacterium]|nr:TlyA family RNA methyltransferase [Actinomycetes bacterium]
MKRLRADELMVTRALAPDLKEAAALIMADMVRTGTDNGVMVDKPGMLLAEDAPLTVKASKKYVSRGGLKLEGALDAFDIDVAGLRCADIGASTGGFTDCLLAHGATSVCAIDVGYGQLAHSLQVDPRVQIHDRTNIRTVEVDALGGPFDLVVADLSFIGLSQVAENIAQLVDERGQCILLVKPQFEAKRDEVGQGGIITDPAIHEQVLQGTIEALTAVGLNVLNVTDSPIKGASGNTEFLLHCRKS